jgi:hypothetical protein
MGGGKKTKNKRKGGGNKTKTKRRANKKKKKYMQGVYPGTSTTKKLFRACPIFRCFPLPPLLPLPSPLGCCHPQPQTIIAHVIFHREKVN